MQPTKSQIHEDVVLTSFAQAYFQKLSNFVAGKVFPVVPVTKSSDKYRIWTKDFWMRDEAKRRAPGSQAVRSGYKLSTDTYSTDNSSIAHPIPDESRRDADGDIDLDKSGTRFVTHRLALRREKQWMADFFATSKWATDKVVANKWSDYAASDPIADVEEGKETIRLSTGYLPNVMVIGGPVWRYLKSHPDIIDRLGLGGSPEETRVVTLAAVAAIFELDAIHVARGVEATSAEGATVATADLAGKHALLAYSSGQPTNEEPSAGVTFGLDTGSVVEGVAGLKIVRMRDDLAHSDLIEGSLDLDNKVVGSDLGYFFNGVVA